MESVPFVVYGRKELLVPALIGKVDIKGQLDNMVCLSQLYGYLEKGGTMMGKRRTVMGWHDNSVRQTKVCCIWGLFLGSSLDNLVLRISNTLCFIYFSFLIFLPFFWLNVKQSLPNRFLIFIQVTKNIFSFS